MSRIGTGKVWSCERYLVCHIHVDELVYIHTHMEKEGEREGEKVIMSRDIYAYTHREEDRDG